MPTDLAIGEPKQYSRSSSQDARETASIFLRHTGCGRSSQADASHEPQIFASTQTWRFRATPVSVGPQPQTWRFAPHLSRSARSTQKVCATRVSVGPQPQTWRFAPHLSRSARSRKPGGLRHTRLGRPAARKPGGLRHTCLGRPAAANLEVCATPVSVRSQPQTWKVCATRVSVGPQPQTWRFAPHVSRSARSRKPGGLRHACLLRRAGRPYRVWGKAPALPVAVFPRSRSLKKHQIAQYFSSPERFVTL